MMNLEPSDVAFLLGPLALGIGVPAAFRASYSTSCATPNRSRLQPPGWVFGVAWTTLYALYGLASLLAWRAGGRRMTPELWASAALLAGLVAWPVVFFSTCAQELAFAAILALLGLASAVALLYARLRTTRWPALLSLPLVAWLYFASFLAFAAIPPARR